jgi:hypothetical protein
LQGAGGFGKTTLAAALCHDDRVITAFDDGVLWVTLGQTPNMQSTVTKLYASLTGERLSFQDTEEAATHFVEALADRNCLLVIDDVWDAAHLEPLLRGGPDCTRVITTRRFDIAADCTTLIVVDEMTTAEATDLLLHGQEAQQHSRVAFENLARRLGEWPLMLELAAATIRKRSLRGEQLDQAIRYVNQALDHGGVTALDTKNATQRNQAITATMRLSLNELDPDERAACIQLAIFPDDVDIPIAAAAALWSMPLFEAGRLAERQADVSLFRLDLESGTIRIHDVVRAYLSEQLADPAAVHARLLDGWGDLYNLPDAYAWQWIGYHLYHAGRQGELHRLLMDFAWLHAKLYATDTAALVGEFDWLQDAPSLAPERCPTPFRACSQCSSKPVSRSTPRASIQ